MVLLKQGYMYSNRLDGDKVSSELITAAQLESDMQGTGVLIRLSSLAYKRCQRPVAAIATLLAVLGRWVTILWYKVSASSWTSSGRPVEPTFLFLLLNQTFAFPE